MIVRTASKECSVTRMEHLKIIVEGLRTASLECKLVAMVKAITFKI